MVFFTDAVVAIAMTLLILPLMESVSEAAGEGLSATAWWEEHTEQLAAFVLSFVLVGTFWRTHHTLYEHLERYTSRLMTLNFVWMFTIVVLPVATAISGQLPTDRTSLLLYIGTLLATALTALVTQVHVLRHPELWRADHPVTWRGPAINGALALLLAIALVLALVVPGLGYRSMFLLLLMWPLTIVLTRVIGRRARPDEAAEGDAVS